MENTPAPIPVVVSFTTSPTRLQRCRPVIDSLTDQTRRPDAILLNLPPRFDRTGEEYPPDERLPGWLVGNPLVEIQRCDRDWGPATKLVPTVVRLQREGRRCLVITVDDDVRYPSGAIAALAGAALPCAGGGDGHDVWCAAGFDFVDLRPKSVKAHGECCAVAEGFAGVAYPIEVFGADFVPCMQGAAADADLRLADDVVLSNYLACHGVNRRVLTSPEYSQGLLWELGGVLDYGNRADALHRGAGTSVGNAERYLRVLVKLAAGNTLCISLKGVGIAWGDVRPG